MRELKTLKKLAESRVTGTTERLHRKWCLAVDDKLDAIGDMLKSPRLAAFLKEGGFPATESKAMLDAFKKFENEFHDFEMATLIDTENPED